MTARKTTPLLLGATLTLLGTLFVQAQNIPQKWPPKPLELSAPPQTIESAPVPLADQRLKLAQTPWAIEPKLETDRQSTEAADANANIKIETNFECGYAPGISKLSPTHFAINVNQREVYMFYFRLTGAKGKTVRIDLKNLNSTNLLKLTTLNPVYTETLALNEIPIINNEAPFTAKTMTVTNGDVGSIELPDTSKQSWHFIENVWVDHEHSTLSFVNTFTTDTVYVAMKYPYSPGLNDKLFAKWENSPYAKSILVGNTGDDRTLRILRITDIPAPQWSKYPSVVIYAREHPDEHDGSWACLGAIDFLLGNSRDAIALRGQAIFHIIPLLDPDSAASTIHSGIITGFAKRSQRKENRSFAKYFAQWVDAGGSLDIVVNLHNVESAERNYHLSVALTEPAEGRLTLANVMNNSLVGSLGEQGYKASPSGDSGHTPTRLAGWLDDTFGAMDMAYELNSQEPRRHLLLSEVSSMGAIIAKVAGNYVSGAEGKDLRESVREIEAVRNAGKSHVTFIAEDGVFETEYKIKEWRARR